MPTPVNRYDLGELAHGDSKNEVLISSKLNTELYIIVESDRTIISLPFGNKFDIVGGRIIIHEK